jgi:hypothetical protein
MKLYISGPMTGFPEHNFPAFFRAQTELELAGFEVSNPAQYPVVEGETWEACLKRDIKDLVDCDGVAVLPDWRISKGARLEVDIADRLKLPVRSVTHWLTIGPNGKALA